MDALIIEVICGTILVQGQTSCTHCPGFRCINCIDGYYPSGKDCRLCYSPNCVKCETDGMCTSCKTGFFGALCANTCGTGCINGTCGFNTGQCQCLDGFHLLYCNQACSDRCQDACDKTSGVCRCPPVFYGLYCNYYCLSQCAECTNSTSCSVCSTGKYGATCNMYCITKCNNGACDKHTGHCGEPCPVKCQTCTDEDSCTSCDIGYYGTKCENTCPINCEQRCYLTTGTCSSCRIGWYGNDCTTSCSDNLEMGARESLGNVKHVIQVILVNAVT